MTGAVLGCSGGETLAADDIVPVIDESPEILPEAAGMSVTEIPERVGPAEGDRLIGARRETLISHALIAVFGAAMLLFRGLSARRGTTSARVLITIFAVLSAFPYLLFFGGHPPPMVGILSILAVVAAAIAIVFWLLPANNRYAKADKAAHIGGRRREGAD
ncbi:MULTISPECIES: hypothetical protein [Actinoalloteichus]|uniref:Uncharacterized protein n=1 Tax=Actinoalloteichus fjordicus TaxID=1612552 RepID=A0AAC9PR00_9PSEU|nr:MULTISPECIES: hypothetical protein [Actinoalloteichus]APU13595.1 hypothetical protein UA74_07630 [Actinoalloteichus fjordicus]APU19542.1 hypothetical protein UA75_07615 [Actinoalloteichus sp. GBA129-24]